MVIHNEIFDSYRLEVDEINQAIRLLVRHQYKIIDTENQLIHSGNVDKSRERVTFRSMPKQKRVYLNNNKNESNVN